MITLKGYDLLQEKYTNLLKQHKQLQSYTTAVELKIRERCICSAIKLVDGTLIRGNRHNDCLLLIKANELNRKGSVQGFITSTGRFVDREEAYLLQIIAGIKSMRGEYSYGYLFSEDLY